jgi:multiple sugar transport system permease protein
MSIERTLPVPRVVSRRAGQRRTSSLLQALALALILVVFLFPILYLAVLTVTAQDDVLSGRLLPARLAWENWPATFAAQPILLFLRNSLAVALGSALLTLLIAVPATYAMARFGVGGTALHQLTLSSYMAPPIVAIIPLFFLLRAVGLTNSLAGLALVHGLANLPVAVWLLDGFIRELPIEIEEAALVDGAGIGTTLVRVVLPLIAPGVVAAAIICLILSYNEFLFALILTYSPETQTLPVGVALFQGDRLVQFGQMAVASLTAMLPVYLVALFFQRWLIKGLTSGSGK